MRRMPLRTTPQRHGHYLRGGGYAESKVMGSKFWIDDEEGGLTMCEKCQGAGVRPLTRRAKDA